LKDADLLDHIYSLCQEIRDTAWDKAVTEFAAPLTDDPRWLSPYPLQPELQLRYLFLQSLDALDLAALGLRARTSTAAIGAVRLLAECCVLVKWLTEEGGAEQRKRAYRLAMDGVKRTRRLQKHAKGGITDAQLDAMKSRLLEIARRDGVQHVGEAPDATYLFNKFLRPGYAAFSVLSEIGSHAGFFQVVLFHLDPKTDVVAVDFDGSPAERALWTAQAFELTCYTVDEVGKALGWDDWLQAEVAPLVRRAKPAMKDVHNRWRIKWGLEDGDSATASVS
jgi:hypothetical protein